MTTAGSISCNYNSSGPGAGNCTFTPAAGFTGTATARYRVEWWTPQGWPSDEGWMVFTVSNSAPAGNSDAIAITRNTPVVDIWVLANDYDADGDPITMDTLTYSQPSSGSLHCQSNGRCQYGPPKGWTGTTSFYYRATDGIAVSTPTKVTIKVTNRAPVGANQTFTLAQGQEQLLNLLQGAYEPDGDPITVKAMGAVSAGTLNWTNYNGYFPGAFFAPLQNTTVVVDYFIADDLGAGIWVTLTFVVNGPPLASPVASPFAASPVASPVAVTPVSSASTPFAAPATPITRGSGATRTGITPTAAPSIETSVTETPADETTNEATTEPTAVDPIEPTVAAEQTVAPAEPTAEPTEVVVEAVATEVPPAASDDGDSTPFAVAAISLPGDNGPDKPASGLMDHIGVFITGLFVITACARIVAVFRAARRRRVVPGKNGYALPTPPVTMHGVAD
jgi:hypothetical protein